MSVLLISQGFSEGQVRRYTWSSKVLLQCNPQPSWYLALWNGADSPLLSLLPSHHNPKSLEHNRLDRTQTVCLLGQRMRNNSTFRYLARELLYNWIRPKDRSSLPAPSPPSSIPVPIGNQVVIVCFTGGGWVKPNRSWREVPSVLNCQSETRSWLHFSFL